MKDDRVLLAYIRESTALVDTYVGGQKETFYGDLRTQDAVLRRMETLADAAARLSDDVKQRHPDIPWRQIGDFRNAVAHGYAEIRLDQVWQAIVDDLPALSAVVEQELQRQTDN